MKSRPNAYIEHRENIEKISEIENEILLLFFLCETEISRSNCQRERGQNGRAEMKRRVKERGQHDNADIMRRVARDRGKKEEMKEEE